jgi:pyrroline-5-carboxylate reductase
LISNPQTKIIKKLNKSKLKNLDIVLLAVKPAQIKSVCAQIKPLIKNLPLIISIAAGVTTAKLKKYLNDDDTYIVRAMPNLCAKTGTSITGLFGISHKLELKLVAKPFGAKGGTKLGKKVSKIFSSFGQVLWVELESDLDSVTAISGSGPAYIYFIMNAMIEAAIELGLKKSDAQRLVAQTIIGAGETGKDIDNLESEIIKVSSKGGTTEKAISIFKQKKLDTIIKQAVKAAHKRSKELSK